MNKFIWEFTIQKMDHTKCASKNTNYKYKALFGSKAKAFAKSESWLKTFPNCGTLTQPWHDLSFKPGRRGFVTTVFTTRTETHFLSISRRDIE